MRRILYLSLALTALIIPSCRISQGYNSREFSPGSISLTKDPAYNWKFGDLNANNTDYLITAASYSSESHYVLIRDQNGKEISQISFRHKVRGIKVLTDPRDQKRWIFLSVNDQKSTTVSAYHYIWENSLKRENKDFEAIPRTDALISRTDYEWFGQVSPVLLEDIDNDGKPELVCLAQDSFTVNPRGLVVYDFDSGKVKWRLNLSTSIISLLCDDFDGDGVKELVCGTIASKNTGAVMEGMDNLHSWLFVLNPRGEMLHQEMVNEGYSYVQLASADKDKDGKKEILAVYSTKGNAETPNTVSWISWTGARFVPQKTWSLAGNFEQNNNDTIYNVVDPEGRGLVLLVALNSALVFLDQDLHEVHHNFRDPVSYIWSVEDLDIDGKKEILVQTVDNRFVILNSELQVMAELPNPHPQDKVFLIQTVKTGFGKHPKIAILSSPEVRYYSYERLPAGILIGRFIGLHLVPISIVLALFPIFLMLFIFHRRKIFKMAINNLNQGVIIVLSRGRILMISNYLLNLLRDEDGQLPPGNLKALDKLFPEINALLPDFVRSKAPAYSCSLKLGRQQVCHALNIQRLRGLSTRFLITLQPELPSPATTDATLAWADTARRLSHNVRQHITNVILALKPLQAEGLDETQINLTAVIRSEIEKIRIFTHAFQRFTELKDYNLKQMDVIPSISHCLERVTIPEGVKLIKNWNLKSIEALIEPIRFEEALTNVLTNALEAMSGAGTLHLSVKEFPLHAGPQGNLSVMIEVEDSGKGIPAKYLEEVWQPFFTTKASGTGIGLPETKKIIQSMGGTILVQSEEGVGTVVTFWLKGSSDG